MSMWRYDFVIYGFDLSDIKDEILEWLDETKEGRACYAELHTEEIGKWSLFDDPADGDHFYLGYVLGKCDEYDGFVKPVKADITELNYCPPRISGSVPEAFYNRVSCLCGVDDAMLYVFSKWR